MNETQNGTCVQCGTQGTILALKVETKYTNGRGHWYRSSLTCFGHTLNVKLLTHIFKPQFKLKRRSNSLNSATERFTLNSMPLKEL